MEDIKFENAYIKVGSRFYRVIDQPSWNKRGEQIEPKRILAPWQKMAIIQDHGNDFAINIRTFNTKHELPQDLRELYEEMPKKNKWLNG